MTLAGWCLRFGATSQPQSHPPARPQFALTMSDMGQSADLSRRNRASSCSLLFLLPAQGADMKHLTTLAMAAALALTSGVAMAQSTGNAGNPANANTTDPGSSPSMGAQGTRPASRELDAAGRA